MPQKSIWTTPISLEEINRRAQKSLSDYLGIIFTALTEESLTATMPVDACTLQPMGIMHGGASAALAETVASAAANYCVDQTQEVCVGLELNINHIRAVKAGTIAAIAKPLHLGKRTQVWEIKIENEQGELISAARLTLMVLKKN